MSPSRRHTYGTDVASSPKSREQRPTSAGSRSGDRSQRSALKRRTYALDGVGGRPTDDCSEAEQIESEESDSEEDLTPMGRSLGSMPVARSVRPMKREGSMKMRQVRFDEEGWPDWGSKSSSGKRSFQGDLPGQIGEIAEEARAKRPGTPWTKERPRRPYSESANAKGVRFMDEADDLAILEPYIPSPLRSTSAASRSRNPPVVLLAKPPSDESLPLRTGSLGDLPPRPMSAKSARSVTSDGTILLEPSRTETGELILPPVPQRVVGPPPPLPDPRLLSPQLKLLDECLDELIKLPSPPLEPAPLVMPEPEPQPSPATGQDRASQAKLRDDDDDDDDDVSVEELSPLPPPRKAFEQTKTDDEQANGRRCWLCRCLRPKAATPSGKG
eukprot:TRINITY_DN3166_c0_g1_i1.p1 TRINITY_DN3166_c0_g1~~TRINITY_DN3166_c0_g1_i1.p1  ORF type:complete len:386 (-),score=76.79 TRINITY_DN3166_c0_g1_i1:147-1304(-)